jgi:sugar O-acyltransferase (sialic acid O-acetyltransferase NeuD family)
MLILNKMKNLIIIGAGDWGLEVWSWLEHAQGFNTEWRFKGFLDNNQNALNNLDFCDAKILGSEDTYLIEEDDIFICTIANTIVKEKVTNKIIARGGSFTNLIHQSVIFFKNITLGKGIVLSPNCVVSNSCTIGNHISINLGTTLGHDVIIGNFCQINSQCDITGHVKIGNNVFIGSSVTIIPKVKVGNNVKIGAGSVVLRSIKDDKSVFGNPAKEIM